jgi:hypothetical protein
VSRPRATGEGIRDHYGSGGVLYLGRDRDPSASPFQLFKILANMAGFVLFVAGIQIFLVNRRFLPRAVRAPLRREIGLLACSGFYAFFTYFVVRDLLRSLF